MKIKKSLLGISVLLSILTPMMSVAGTLPETQGFTSENSSEDPLEISKKKLLRYLTSRISNHEKMTLSEIKKDLLLVLAVNTATSGALGHDFTEEEMKVVKETEWQIESLQDKVEILALEREWQVSLVSAGFLFPFPSSYDVIKNAANHEKPLKRLLWLPLSLPVDILEAAAVVATAPITIPIFIAVIRNLDGII